MIAPSIYLTNYSRGISDANHSVPAKKNANHSGCKLSHWSTVGLGSSQTGRASRWGSKLGHGRAMEKNRRDRGKKALDAAFHGQGLQQSLSSVSVCGKGIRIRSDFLCVFFLTFRRLRTMANCTYASQPVAFTVRCAPPHELAMAIDRAFGGRGRRNKQNGYCAQGPASW